MVHRRRSFLEKTRTKIAASLRKKGISRNIVRIVRQKRRLENYLFVDFSDIWEERTEELTKSAAPPVIWPFVDASSKSKKIAYNQLMQWINTTTNPVIANARRFYNYFYVTRKGIVFTNYKPHFPKAYVSKNKEA